MKRPYRPATMAAIALAILAKAGLAQSPGGGGLPPRALLEERAARRFPQPVRVGDLAGRKVLGTTESQPVLGRVAAIVRDTDGRTSMIVRLAAWFWERERVAAVPIEAVALLGEHVALLDVTADELRDLATLDPAAVSEVAQDDVIRVGLAKPFH